VTILLLPAKLPHAQDTAADDGVSNADTTSRAAPAAPDPALLGQSAAAEQPPEFNPPLGTGELEFTIDEASKALLGDAVVRNYTWTLERNQAVYRWQDLSTKLIFAAVLLLVFAGVAFSGIQFFKGFRTKTAKGEAPAVSQVELSAKGIKVTSPFLGVIVLVVSLAFFYLYLVYVYPISLTR
jgi:hypothetical protein